MKSFVFIVATLLASSEATTAASADLTEIAGRMSAIDCYKADCTYEVLLASLSQPVTYTVSLESSAASADTLAPCHYIIRWSLPQQPIPHRAFRHTSTAHTSASATSVCKNTTGVERTVVRPPGRHMARSAVPDPVLRVAPAVYGRAFSAKWRADTSYIYTVKTVNDAVVIDGVRRFGGYDGAEYTYTLDAATLLPRRIELENNPVR